ncbi:MAG: hypothetical protein NTV06_03795, partial [candidate division Zixibacteria bacterium]|nr:hypothetical protein [candidate division Zixibacteria bacterium]
GVPSTGTFRADDGLANTFNCIDDFVPTGGAAQPSQTLDIVVDDVSGLAVGVSGLGGGGVEVSSLNGLLDGVAKINTTDTTHAASMTVYDSQGGRHSLTLQFLKSVNSNEWSWSASFTGSETIVGGGTGTVRFNDDGSLLAFNYVGGATGLTFNPIMGPLRRP